MQRCQDARILLVDDEPELLELVAQALRGAGYVNLALAGTAAQAHAAFSSFAPDFIVLDVNLPGDWQILCLRVLFPAVLFVASAIPCKCSSLRRSPSGRLSFI